MKIEIQEKQENMCLLTRNMNINLLQVVGCWDKEIYEMCYFPKWVPPSTGSN